MGRAVNARLRGAARDVTSVPSSRPGFRAVPSRAPRLAAQRRHTQARAGAKLEPRIPPSPRGEQRPRGAMGCGASAAAALPLPLGPLEAWSEQARARAGGW